MAAAVEANTTLGVLQCADNHLSNDALTEIEYAMGRPKSTVREVVGQVRSIYPQAEHVKSSSSSTPHRQLEC